MKSVLFALFLSPALCFCQIEIKPTAKNVQIGEVKAFGTLIANLTYTVDGVDTSYTFLFNNMKYERITDFQTIFFKSDGNTLHSFYDVLKTFFKEENKNNKDYEVNFSLGSDNIIARNAKAMGKASVMIWTDKGFVILNDKQVDKLFGKI